MNSIENQLVRKSFYNDVCKSLRTYGNRYGSNYQRGWGWLNPGNPSERCAIAQFVSGSCDLEIVQNLKKRLGLLKHESLEFIDIVRDVIDLFDHYAFVVNNKNELEHVLMGWADKYSVEYSVFTVDAVIESSEDFALSIA